MTIATPPITWMVRECFRSTSMLRTAFAEPSATSKNGSPSPRQYAMTSSTPRAAVMPAVPTETDTMAASVGPKHGVHPSANTPPSSGAPSSVVHFFGRSRL